MAVKLIHPLFFSFYSLELTGDIMTDEINESEINTIPYRIEVVSGLLRTIEEANEKGDIKTAVRGLNETIKALNSLDDRLVKVQRKHMIPVVNESNFQERLSDVKERFKNIIDYINDAGGPNKFL